jgi:hypothetical protein
MTPDEYRAKWKLPADYPMVAPDYAAQRSELAKRFGLGHRAETVAAQGRAGHARRRRNCPFADERRAVGPPKTSWPA